MLSPENKHWINKLYSKYVLQHKMQSREKIPLHFIRAKCSVNSFELISVFYKVLFLLVVFSLLQIFHTTKTMWRIHNLKCDTGSNIFKKTEYKQPNLSINTLHQKWSGWYYIVPFQSLEMHTENSTTQIDSNLLNRKMVLRCLQ